MDWFFAHIVTAVELFFAGAWTMIWERGLGIGLIIFFVALAFGSQMLAGIPMFGPFLAAFFAPLRKDLLWAAFGVALILGGEYVGAAAEKKKCVAQTVVIEHVTDKAVAKTKTPRARAAKDRWDNPEN
jgi:hypothetical protein